MDKKLTPFFNEIRGFLTTGQIITDPSETRHFAQDWSGVLTPQSTLTVFPKSTEEVAKILECATRHQIQVVPSGGRTGLSGGAVATQGEVVLSLTKMNFIEDVIPGASCVRVGAGAITQAVHEACHPHGLTWPVDFASKGSSTVGGNLATNAGGIRVLKYGNTRNWVLGMTLVTMDGKVHDLNGALEKNNTGYDLRQLLIGSEGTLGVITEATLKLCPIPQSSIVCLFAVKSFEKVVNLFQLVRSRTSNLSAFECFDQNCYQVSMKHQHRPSLFDASIDEQTHAYVVMELESDDHLARLKERSQELLETILESGLVVDGILSQTSSETEAIWKVREGIAEALLQDHTVHQEDVSVPIQHLSAFYSTIHQRYQQTLPEYATYFFGHIGDGNIHIFIQKPDETPREEFFKKTHDADLELFQILKTYSGSISAEHGIGLLKKHALSFSRSEAEVAFFRSIKHTFDPDGLLNPGKIF